MEENINFDGPEKNYFERFSRFLHSVDDFLGVDL